MPPTPEKQNPFEGGGQLICPFMGTMGVIQPPTKQQILAVQSGGQSPLPNLQNIPIGCVQDGCVMWNGEACSIKAGAEALIELANTLRSNPLFGGGK